MSAHGLLMVITGPGKGKTTAALGQAIRMAGHGKRVAFLQCIKNRECGEHRSLERFQDLIDLRLLGAGFTWTGDEATHVAAARSAWEQICQVLSNPDYALVVLDEFTYVLTKKMVSWTEFTYAFSRRPAAMHVLITGRGALPELCAAADLVSVIAAEKHPYQKGVASQQGIEF